MFTHNRIHSCHTHLTYVTQPLSENLRVGEKSSRMNTDIPIVLFTALDFKFLTVTQLNSIFVCAPISQDGELNLGWTIVCLWTICSNVLKFLGWGHMCKFWLSACSFTLISVISGQVKKTTTIRGRKPFPIPALSNWIFSWKWWKCSLSEQSNTIVSSHRWLLGTWNVANATTAFFKF